MATGIKMSAIRYLKTAKTEMKLLSFTLIHNELPLHCDTCYILQVHFFDREESYMRGLEFYRKQMPYTFPEQLTGEKSPGYYREKDAPERIHRMNSTIKVKTMNKVFVLLSSKLIL